MDTHAPGLKTGKLATREQLDICLKDEIKNAISDSGISNRIRFPAYGDDGTLAGLMENRKTYARVCRLHLERMNGLLRLFHDGGGFKVREEIERALDGQVAGRPDRGPLASLALSRYWLDNRIEQLAEPSMPSLPPRCSGTGPVLTGTPKMPTG